MDISFHYNKLIVSLVFDREGSVPEHKTSALRGGIGQALIRMHCVNSGINEADCDGCFYHDRCIVQSILYAPFKNRPQYVTRRESGGLCLYCDDRRLQVMPGDVIDLEITFFGNMACYFPLILQAIDRMGRAGLGKNHIPFSINGISDENGTKIEWKELSNSREIRINDSGEYVNKRKKELGLALGDVKLLFYSPVAIKYQGEFIRRFSPEAVISAAKRRIEMAKMFEGLDIDLDMEVTYPETFDQKSHFEHIDRYSERNGGKVRLNGIAGEMVLHGIDEPTLDILLAGEITFIGKNTKFGFGKYKVLTC